MKKLLQGALIAVIVLGSGYLIFSFVVPMPSNYGSDEFVPGEVLVLFADHTTNDDAQSFLRELEAMGLPEQAECTSCIDSRTVKLPVNFAHTAPVSQAQRARAFNDYFDILSKDSDILSVRVKQSGSFRSKINFPSVETFFAVTLSDGYDEVSFAKTHGRLTVIPSEFLSPLLWKVTRPEYAPTDEEIIVLLDAKEEISILKELAIDTNVEGIEIRIRDRNIYLGIRDLDSMQMPIFFVSVSSSLRLEEIELLFVDYGISNTSPIHAGFSQVIVSVPKGEEMEWADRLRSDPRVEVITMNRYYSI